MKLFAYTDIRNEVSYGIAENEEDAYNRREEIDPAFHYSPCTITEVFVNGYTLKVTANKK